MRNQSAYTFVELMVTVAILSVGIVGIYTTLLASLDYQSELTRRLYAVSLIENETALLENQYRLSGELPAEASGKVLETQVDNHAVPYTVSLSVGMIQDVDGLLPVETVLSWPDRGRNFSIKRKMYLVNLNPKPVTDASVQP